MQYYENGKYAYHQTSGLVRDYAALPVPPILARTISPYMNFVSWHDAGHLCAIFKTYLFDKKGLSFKNDTSKSGLGPIHKMEWDRLNYF